MEAGLQRASDDVHAAGDHFVGWRWCRFAFLHLWWSLERHCTGELNGGLAGQSLNGIEGLLADVVRFEEHLRHTGPVSKVDKTNGAFAAIGFHESDDGDFRIQQVRTVGLQFIERVRSIGSRHPSGHGGAAVIEDMKHSLGEIG